MIAVVNVLSRVSTALCRKHTRVRAVPISFDAPKKTNSKEDKLCNYLNK